MNRILVLMAALSLAQGVLAESLNATLDWSRRVALGLTVTGIVENVAVEIGDRVARGDLLVALDDSYLKARIAKAEAELEEARQNREEGVRELERANELYDRTVLSDHDLQLAQIGEARARAAWHRAQTELAEARIMLQQSRINAPFAGLVIAVDAQPGQAVVNALRTQSLITLVDDQQLLARSRLSGQQFDGLAVGDSLAVEVGGKTLPAKVYRIGYEPMANGSGEEVRYELQVIFDRPATLSARAGLPAIIRIGE